MTFFPAPSSSTASTASSPSPPSPSEFIRAIVEKELAEIASREGLAKRRFTQPGPRHSWITSCRRASTAVTARAPDGAIEQRHFVMPLAKFLIRQRTSSGSKLQWTSRVTRSSSARPNDQLVLVPMSPASLGTAVSRSSRRGMTMSAELRVAGRPTGLKVCRIGWAGATLHLLSPSNPSPPKKSQKNSRLFAELDVSTVVPIATMSATGVLTRSGGSCGPCRRHHWKYD